jgi:hypothetical protein
MFVLSRNFPHALAYSLSVLSWSFNTATADVTFEKNPVSAHVIKLLELTDVECEHDLKSVVEATQKHWIRRGERAYGATDSDTKKSAAILETARSAGFINAMEPDSKQGKEIDEFIIYASTGPNMLERLKFASQMVDKYGLQIGNIRLLGGQRALDGRDTMPELFPDGRPKEICTEIDLFRYLFAHLTGIDNLRGIRFCTFIDAQMTGKQRPTTLDTLELLKEQYIKTAKESDVVEEAGSSIKPKKKLIAVTLQPHGPGQGRLTTERVLGDICDCQVAAAAAPKSVEGDTVLLLDTIARYLWETLQAEKALTSK